VGDRGALFWIDADALARYDSPAALAGLVDPLPIRSVGRDGSVTTEHRWRQLPTEREIVAGTVPPIPWRFLVL
jgi:hypothetical protein